MGLFRRRKPQEEEVKEIKKVVEGKKIAEEIIETPEVTEETPKDEDEEEILEEINEEEFKKPLEEIPKQELVPAIVPEMPKEIKPSFAPLFVKLDKYKSVLDTIIEIKSILMNVKNTLVVQREIEDLRDENRKLLETTISQIDKKIISLDSEFLRPKGYEEELPAPIHEAGNLEDVVSDLKKQIESLKSELRTIS
jgi:hypothetical protein